MNNLKAYCHVKSELFWESAGGLYEIKTHLYVLLSNSQTLLNQAVYFIEIQGFTQYNKDNVCAKNCTTSQNWSDVTLDKTLDGTEKLTRNKSLGLFISFGQFRV